MLYDEPVRVPMIVSWKGVTPQYIDQKHLVSGLDIVPTLCDYAGINCPDSMRGVSLRPVIESPDKPGRDHLVCQLHINPEEEGRMLRTQRYKYVLFSMGARPEMLFDLESDPAEVHNLVYEQDYREVLVKHRQLLRQWMADANDDYLNRFGVPETCSMSHCQSFTTLLMKEEAVS
jgi:arylsulfatase A-like enzyme